MMTSRGLALTLALGADAGEPASAEQADAGMFGTWPSDTCLGTVPGTALRAVAELSRRDMDFTSRV